MDDIELPLLKPVKFVKWENEKFKEIQIIRCKDDSAYVSGDEEIIFEGTGPKAAWKIALEYLEEHGYKKVGEDLQQQTENVIRFLVNGEFERVEELTKGVRLTSEQIRHAIENYGRKLILPPSNAFELMETVQIQNAIPLRWSIVMPLWTMEEGRSDLSLELTIIKSEVGYTVELDDIHAL